MIELLGTVFGFVYDILALAISTTFDVIGMVMGFLGGLFSALLGILGIIILIVLLFIFIRRRKKAEAAQRMVDENGVEFSSYYQQDK